MNTVVPPQPPAQAPVSPPPLASVTVLNPPPSLAGLALGARLEGVVLKAAGEGQAQVQTSHGVLTVIASLPPGARLILILQAPMLGQQQGQSQGPGQPPGQQLGQAQFRILSLDGRPPTPSQPATVAAAARGQGAAAPVTLTVGSTVTATLLASAPALVPGSANPAATAAPLQTPGAGQAPGQGQVQVQGLLPGQAQGQVPGQLPGQVQGQGQTAVATATAAARSAPAAAPSGIQVPANPLAASPAALPPGTQVAFRITALQPPSAAPTASPPPAAVSLVAGNALSAVVTGTTNTGQPQVQTAAGAMVLNSAGPLPRGTALTLTVVGEPALPHPAVEGSPSPFSRQGFMHAGAWPNLDDALRALGEINPAVANSLTQSVIPQPNAQLTTHILFFLAALRGGDIRGWMGNEPTRLLQRFKPDLLGRIRDDFKKLSRLAEKPSGGDWRTWLIPLHDGGQIQQIRLITRQGGGDEENEEPGNAGIRFVIDVTLSSIGHLQLDGLANGPGKRLDLIVRTDTPLDKTARNDIRRIFDNAARVTGLVGSVGFQAAPPRFVEVSEAAAGDTMGVTV